MVDHMSGGRVEFGTGRSAAYEQIGMGIDPRHTRAMWEESLAHDPDASGRTASSSGRASSGTSPRARCGPSPTRSPIRAIWVAALQPTTYQLAAELGIGVMALSVAPLRRSWPRTSRPTRSACATATPVGKIVNDQWLSSTMGLLRPGQPGGARAGRQLAAHVLRPGSPLPQGPDAPLRAARRVVGRRARSPEGQLRALHQGRGRGGRARGRPVGRVGTDRLRPVESDRRRHPRRARRPRRRRPRELSAAPSPSTRRPASTSCSSSWPRRRCPTRRSWRRSRCSASTSSPR